MSRRRITPISTLFLLVAVGLVLGPAYAQPSPTTTRVYLPQLSDGKIPFSFGVALPRELLGAKRPLPGSGPLLEGTLLNSTGDLALWIPPNAQPVRGILFRNGTGSNINPADPDWRNDVAQNREQAARQIASLWGFAYLSGAVWTEANRSSYMQQEALLHSALEEFAQRTGRAELRYAPLIISGGSRFSAFGPQYAARHPARVIAYDVVNGGNSVVAPGVPGMMFLGSEDGSAAQVGGSFARDRAQGALLAVALIWGAGHVCDRCVDLEWAFFDAMVRARLPADADPRGGPVALIPLAEESGWLGNVSDWSTIAPYAEYQGDRRAAAWFPSRGLALLWQGFMLKQPPATLTWPTQPYRWSDGFTQEPAPNFGRKPRDLRASLPLEIVATIGQPSGGALSVYTLAGELGAAALSPDGKQAALRGARLDPGLHAFVVVRDGRAASYPAGLVLLP
jgi:hypothetical protein